MNSLAPAAKILSVLINVVLVIVLRFLLQFPWWSVICLAAITSIIVGYTMAHYWEYSANKNK
jgi:hypothetical protein